LAFGPEEWGPLPALEDVAVPLDEDDEDEIDEATPSTRPHGVRERGRSRAFRVLGNLSGLGAAAGAVAPFLVAMLGRIEGWMLLAAPLGLGVLGWFLGGRFARDECSACRASVARDSRACESCGAHFAGSVRNREERLAAEERLGESEPEPESSDEYGDSPYAAESRLMTAMYAAWAIGRDLISPEFAESEAELVVRVRCGELPEPELAELYTEGHNAFSDEAQGFFEDYCQGEVPLGDQDFSRLVSSVKLITSEASYRRVAEILDLRFDEWLKDNRAQLMSGEEVR
jgi:hypothetical protein